MVGGGSVALKPGLKPPSSLQPWPGRAEQAEAPQFPSEPNTWRGKQKTVSLSAVQRVCSESLSQQRNRGEIGRRETILEFCLEVRLLPSPGRDREPLLTLILTLQERRVLCLCLAQCQAGANYLCTSLSHDLTWGHFCPKNQKFRVGDSPRNSCVENGTEPQSKLSAPPWRSRSVRNTELLGSSQTTQEATVGSRRETAEALSQAALKPLKEQGMAWPPFCSLQTETQRLREDSAIQNVLSPAAFYNFLS